MAVPTTSTAGSAAEVPGSPAADAGHFPAFLRGNPPG